MPQNSKISYSLCPQGFVEALPCMVFAQKFQEIDFTTTTHSDYEHFGMHMQGRSFSTNSYKFGFNGKENINEINGWQDYGERMYNRLIGRFPSPDPIIVYQQKYPWYSPYQFAGNTPIQAIDLDGLEELIVVRWFQNGVYVGETVFYVLEASRIKDDAGKSIGGIVIVERNTNPIGVSTSDRGQFDGQLRVDGTNSEKRYNFGKRFIEENNITEEQIQSSNNVYDAYIKYLEPAAENNFSPPSAVRFKVYGRWGYSTTDNESSSLTKFITDNVNFNTNERIQIFVNPSLRENVLENLKTKEGFSETKIQWLDAPLNNPNNTAEINYVDLKRDDNVTY